MATGRSAGLLLYRIDESGALQVLIGHMGGPYWRGKPLHSWSIPKGEYLADEDPFRAAQREFLEETGMRPPAGEYRPLGDVRQSGGKIVTVWAVQSDLDVTAARSNTFAVEWPPGSGQMKEFPEIDRLEWRDVTDARELLVRAQSRFLDLLTDEVGKPN
jgi:predicted NUDIX family NTP pyrophosphohydrolase